MAERYANCTVSHEMHSDRRFDLLAELGGWTRNDACWRMVQLWARCTAMQTDCPPAEEIRIHLGMRGEQLLLDAALAERRAGGGVRVLGGGLTGGDTDRFSWYAPVTHRNVAGGIKRAATASRGARGRFVAGASHDQRRDQQTTSDSSQTPATYPQAPASGFRISEIRDLPPARDPAVPSTVPSPAPEAPTAEQPSQPGPDQRRALRESIRAELERKRTEVAAKLGATINPLLAFDHGLDVDLAGRVQLVTTWPALELLATQATHAIAMAALETELGLAGFEFLTGSVFSGRNFSRLANATEAGIRAKARAGPRSSAPRATSQPMIRPKFDEEPPP